MKSRKYIVLIYFLSIGIFQIDAQIGINVEQANAVLYIDPKGDTSGTANTGDDVVILNNARLGIGTATPSVNLDLQGKLRITDGTEGDLKLLLSDKDGLASWGAKALETIQGKLPATLTTIVGATVWRYAGASITLPKGSWIIYFQANYNSSPVRGGNIWWDLSSSQTTHYMSAGRCLSNYGYPSSICSTNAVYFVSLTTPTTYYLWGSSMNLYAGESMTYLGNANFYAIQVN